MLICGIIGWKNSGKTYLAQKIINYFNSKNYKVASIKHAHHEFEIDKPHTDSYLHRKAGSQEILVSSSKRWVKIVELRDSHERKIIVWAKNHELDFEEFFEENYDPFFNINYEEDLIRAKEIEEKFITE